MTTAILAVPKWLIVLRGLQFFFALIVLGLSAYGVYWIAFNSWGFAIFLSLATFIIVLYGVLTTKITKWNVAYNGWAIVALDAFGVLFWLSCMGSLAATRAIFVIPATLNGCVNDGGIGGGICYKNKRAIEKRSFVATNGYLSMMSGAAGLSALEFILFVVTLVFSSIALHRLRKAGQTGTTGNVEAALPMENVQHNKEAAVHQQELPQYAQQPGQGYQSPPPDANGQYVQAPPQQQPQQYVQQPTQQY